MRGTYVEARIVRGLSRRGGAAAFVALTLLAAPARVARAAPTHTRPARTTKDTKNAEEEARKAMRRGFEAFARGQSLVALEEYQRAQLLVPEANLPYRYAGEALAQLGRNEEAIASFAKYLRINPNVADAEAINQRIEALRATLTAPLTVTCALPQLAVRLDEGATVTGPCPLELRVTGGAHTLSLRAPGKRDAQLSVVTDPGVPFRVQVALDDGPPGVQEVARPPSVPPVSSTAMRGSPPRTARAVSYVLLGAGVAALATALVVDLALLGGAIDDFDSAADRGDPSASSRRSRVDTLKTVGIIGYASAALLGASGGVLLVVSPSTTVRASPAAWGGTLHAALTF